MKISTLFGRTLREVPAEADYIAHQLVLRAGLVRSMQAGSYALLPLGMKVVRRIEQIIHEEMERIGGQEFRTPVIQSSEAWQQTGRLQQYGALMLRLSDRAERPLLFAPTHEEAVAQLAIREISSYRQMPSLIYQIHTKYRDEIRPKGGLMRMREFTMLDAYSLDADDEGLEQAYELVGEAFERILRRCGVSFITVDASGGEMGTGHTREYMAISPVGEDVLVLCDKCGYAANLEVAVCAVGEKVDQSQIPPAEPILTPNCATIADVAAFVGVPKSATAKAVFFETLEHGLLFVVIRGDLEVNELKLKALMAVSSLAPASTEQIVAIGAVAGYASPVGLQNVTVIADHSVVNAAGLVAGANREGYHLLNVLYGRDWQASQVADIAFVQEGESCAECGTPLRYEKGIEVGHIFKLGTKYSNLLGATCLDPNGKTTPLVMGSYGIGVERLMQIIVEQHHDQSGIIWPKSVAPFDIYLISLDKGNAETACDELYTTLQAAGLRVLYDERKERAGVKFNDADLIGLPLRLLVSKRLLKEGVVELKVRDGEAIKVALEEVHSVVSEMLKEVI